MPNYNSTTGIAYGVIQANNVPYLFDEILQSGTNNAYDRAVREIVDAIERIREQCENDDDEFIAEVNAYIDSNYSPHSWDYVDDVDFDAEELASSLLEDWEYDGYDYSYSCDGYEYELSDLGGAGIIFVIKSPFVAVCKRCSPCVPGAGDLDNIVATFDDGDLAYCVDPADINPDSDCRDCYDIEDNDLADYPDETFKVVTLRS